MDSKPVQAPTPNIGPCCLNCRFWQALPGIISAKSPVTLKTAGECHRRAPKAQLIPNGGGFGVQGLFPPVAGADWCGEHEPEPVYDPKTDPDLFNAARKAGATGGPTLA
jgi:hypothetical protein